MLVTFLELILRRIGKYEEGKKASYYIGNRIIDVYPEDRVAMSPAKAKGKLTTSWARMKSR